MHPATWRGLVTTRSLVPEAHSNAHPLCCWLRTGAAGSSLATHLPATAANLSNLNLSDKTFSFSVAR